MKPKLPIGSLLLFNFGGSPSKFEIISETDGRYAMRGGVSCTLYCIATYDELLERQFVILPSESAPVTPAPKKGLLARLFNEFPG